MMYKAFLVKYAEIGIKGKNRHLFEKALCVQMEHALAPVDGNFQVTREMGRIYVNTEGDFDYEGAVDALTRVFGIAEICPVVILEDTGFEDLAEAVVSYVKELYPTEEKTFKVCARRANKNYPMHTMEVNCELGGRILDVCPNLKVDVHEPDIYLNVELRQKIYLYCESIAGPGGMPVGTNGQAMLLLSGGIDSPVAGYMIAKRGVKIDAVYFHAPPYTSERAKQKVVDLHAPLYDEDRRSVCTSGQMPWPDHRREYRTGGKPDDAFPRRYQRSLHHAGLPSADRFRQTGDRRYFRKNRYVRDIRSAV